MTLIIAKATSNQTIIRKCLICQHRTEKFMLVFSVEWNNKSHFWRDSQIDRLTDRQTDIIGSVYGLYQSDS